MFSLVIQIVTSEDKTQWRDFCRDSLQTFCIMHTYFEVFQVSVGTLRVIVLYSAFFYFIYFIPEIYSFYI